MAKQQPTYDRLANQYDFLSRLVFFKSQVSAQTDQLGAIKNCKNLLIVGGGTGWILKNLNAFPIPIKITFIETSIKMIALAKKVVTHHEVFFIHQDVINYKTEIKFDSVLTPFLFDNFDNNKAKNVFGHIDEMLAEKALWLYTDFILDGKWWKKILLKSMHLFFSLLKVVRVNEMPNLADCFKDKGYQLVRVKNYYRGFIEAKVYQKP